MYKLIIPDNIVPSQLAPTYKELEWMHNSLTPFCGKIKTVLEFGCGITTWAIYTALAPVEYVAIEMYDPCIKQIKEVLPEVSIHSTNWNKLDKFQVDMTLIDGSTGYKDNMNYSGVYRTEAIKFVQPWLSKNALVMIHDHDKNRGGYKKAREYLEQNFDFVSSFSDRSGVGLYRSR